MISDSDARQSIVATCQEMNALGINQGTSGNISVRHGDRMFISPSAIPYEEMLPEQIAEMPLNEEYGIWSGPCFPSTEWRIHLDLLRARPDIGAVIHGHPIFCTALAMTRRPIPACHYMIAAFGGADIRCAPYTTYGTSELAALALEALDGRYACLLANHGMVVCGQNLRRAMWLAVELETLARQYYHALLIGGPTLLDETQVAEAAQKLSGYGLKD